MKKVFLMLVATLAFVSCQKDKTSEAASNAEASQTEQVAESSEDAEAADLPTPTGDAAVDAKAVAEFCAEAYQSIENKEDGAQVLQVLAQVGESFQKYSEENPEYKAAYDEAMAQYAEELQSLAEEANKKMTAE